MATPELKQPEDLQVDDKAADNDHLSSGESSHQDQFEEDDNDEGTPDEGDSSLDDDEGAKLEDDYYEIKQHPSYEQVMLDVNRCAGRLEHIRQCYLHRTDDDEPPENPTDEPELQPLASSSSSSSSSDEDEDEDDETKIARVLAAKKENCTENVKENDRLQRFANDLQYQRKLKRKLAKLIVRLLIRKPNLHYYQGFHDVCLTYMAIYGESDALIKLDQVIDTHFSAFMQPTMIETQEFLELIPIIIGLQNQQARNFLYQAEVGTIFALSWVITWFSHVIPNERDVEAIFSHLEKTNDPHLILYLCAEIVVYKSEELLHLEPELSTVHHYLCQVPRKEKLPVAELLERATQSFKLWPPHFVKEKLDQHRREKLQVRNYNMVRNLAGTFMPTMTSIISSSGSRRTALVVFLVASVLAIQFDRWMR